MTMMNIAEAKAVLNRYPTRTTTLGIRLLTLLNWSKKLVLTLLIFQEEIRK